MDNKEKPQKCTGYEKAGYPEAMDLVSQFVSSYIF